MQIVNITQGTDEWREFRSEKISGTKVGKLFAKSRKSDEMFDTDKPNLQFYQVLAERLAVATNDGVDELSAMERGHQLEAEARDYIGQKLDLKIKNDSVWQDEDNPHFMCSPDGYEDSDKPTWAVEIKCLSSANHIKAIVENDWPREYEYQILNYFLINPDLEKLYFCLYDPRFFNEELQLKVFTFNRADVGDKVEQLRFVRGEAERKINEFVEKVSF